MRQGMTLAEAAREIERQAGAKADYVVDTRRMSMAADEGGIDLVIDGPNGGESMDFGIRDHAHGQLADRLKIPKVYYDRMKVEQPELLAQNVNTWFGAKGERRLVRTMDGDVRAFLSDRYRPRDNEKIAELLLPEIGKLGPDVRIESIGLTETRFYLKAVLPMIRAEIRVGDPVCAGVVISNSEVGVGRFLVESLIFRLLCKNGAIAGETFSRQHLGGRLAADEESYAIYTDETLKADEEAFFLAARDQVAAACSDVTFRLIVEQAKDLAELRIEGDPVAVTTQLAKQHDLADEERGSILRHLIEGGDLTGWGYVNAITRASQDVESYDRATDLERLGGELLASEEGSWEFAKAAA